MSAGSCPPPSSFLARVLWLGAGLRVPRCWWPLGGSRVPKGGESADSDLSPSGSPVCCGLGSGAGKARVPTLSLQPGRTSEGVLVGSEPCRGLQATGEDAGHCRPFLKLQPSSCSGLQAAWGQCIKKKQILLYEELQQLTLCYEKDETCCESRTCAARPWWLVKSCPYAVSDLPDRCQRHLLTSRLCISREIWLA